jgi:hypothetical protein
VAAVAGVVIVGAGGAVGVAAAGGLAGGVDPLSPPPPQAVKAKLANNVTPREMAPRFQFFNIAISFKW